jgi:deoxyribodipyrimidine photo-lyase
VVLFNGDLRLHDHPALGAALASAEETIPLFVFDEAILTSRFASPNRLAFLIECLHDLRRSLRAAGGELFVRRGDPAAVAIEWARRHDAFGVFVSADVTRFGRRREQRLSAVGREHGVVVTTHPGDMVVPAGTIAPTEGDHYKVFTPYWRAWTKTAWRSPLGAPIRVPVPRSPRPGRIPAIGGLTSGPLSPSRLLGGETLARAALDRFMRSTIDEYGDRRDDLAGDATSHLGAYLHFGCVSPLEVAARAGGVGGAFVRQLCWRDFHRQVTAAFPAIASRDYRSRQRRWSDDDDAMSAWKSGTTGIPIVDAGMRQLRVEGWMHNRARLIVASFLTRQLGIDWRRGADHFLDWLVDGDIASNSGNWQWVAGTGNDTRPNRRFNVLRQAARFDPEGDYVRRYVDELSRVDSRAVHRPWTLPTATRARISYPDPIVELDAPELRSRR